MYLAYLDDSGDPGFKKGSSPFFLLSCVLVHQSKWLETLDGVVDERRALYSRWGIRPRAELKGADLRWNHGEALKGLKIDLRDRMHIYRRLMRFQAQLDIKVFAVVIVKSRLTVKTPENAKRWAWQVAIERVQTFCEANDEMAMLHPDEGSNDFIQKLIRRQRRIHRISGHYGGQLDGRARLIIEDPVFKNSRNSYFTQMADWNAYAAHRSRYIAPNKRVPLDLWDELRPSLLDEVNEIAGGPPGMVVRPQKTR